MGERTRPESDIERAVRRLKNMGVTLTVTRAPEGEGTFGRAVTDAIDEAFNGENPDD
jgi:hypothetical protein